ncbi:MAG: helicase-related protein [Candidatus Phytoplasma australasiaticum]|nr:helicase-related protein [Candidatus Phytoplasma australasiaticum]
MNTEPTNQDVFKNWYDKAKERQTVIFCYDIAHAEAITKVFKDKNIKTEIVHHYIDNPEQRKIFNDFQTGKIQVIVNVYTLTEGWDCQIVSCVVILRPNSSRSTIKQMIGRGLRIVDHDIYPNILKEDCLILDFGNSIEKYDKTLWQPTHYLNLPKNQKSSESNRIEYLSPQTENKKIIILNKYPLIEKISLSKDLLSPVNYSENTLFRWDKLYKTNIDMTSGFYSFALIVLIKDIWYALGGWHRQKAKFIKILTRGSKSNCFANANEFIKILTRGSKSNCFANANDWLNEYEDNKGNYKNIKKWHWKKGDLLFSTEKQLNYLKMIEKETFNNVNELKKLTQYQMSLLLTYLENKKAINKIITELQSSKNKS